MAKTAFTHKYSFRHCKFQAAEILSDSCNLNIYAGSESSINTCIYKIEEYLIKPQNISGTIISYTSLRRKNKSLTTLN